MNRTRQWLIARTPYQSLAIVAVPLVIVEPAKLLALGIVGNGHWVWGLGVMIAAYTVGIFFLHRLFKIVKPKLLRLRWLAKLWHWYTQVRSKMTAPFTK